MKKLNVYKKLILALMLMFAGIFAAFYYAQADSLKVVITGDVLTDGTWSVGSDPVVWSASAYDGESEDGAAQVLDADSVISWQSSDSEVVKVTPQSSGDSTVSQVELTPVSAGTATITATYKKNVTDENGTVTTLTATAQSKVVVKFEITNPPDSPYEDSDVVSDIYTTSRKNVTFTSSNESVAQISSEDGVTGKVEIKGAGNAIITAQSEDGQKDTCRIVVNASINETDIPVTLVNGESHALKTNAASPGNIYYESGDTNIVETDSEGNITGMSAGRTRVYVKSLLPDDEWYGKLPNPARSVEVEVPFSIMNTPVLNVGDTSVLKTNISDSYSGEVSWNSNNTSVVEITQDGTITAVKSGTATIYATVVNKQIFGTGTPQYAQVTVTVIDAFAISKTEVSVQIGESVELKALVTDDTADVSWESSDADVAAVETSSDDKFAAVVKGMKKGTSTITATQTVNGIKKTAKCEVTVTEPVQDISVYPESVQIDKGNSYPLTITFTPELPDNRDVRWESSDTSVATVDSNGNVSAVGGGQAVIWVITEDGIKVASCDVYVRVPVTGISISETNVSESMSLGTHQLTAAVTPEGPGVDTSIEWSVSPSDGSVIKVDGNGLVTYVAPGNATVIAKSVDSGQIATCQIEVLRPVTSVSLDYTDIKLRMDETFRLSAEVLPTDASDKSVSWESSDSSIVTVDDNGLVTAKSPGSAAVLARTNDGGITAMCNVKVYQPVTGVSISNTELSVKKGTTAWLNAVALPENAENRTIVWSSSDEEVATVDENTGMITAITPGTCTIVATSDDNGLNAKCILTVTQAVTGISLNTGKKTIMKDDQFALTPKVKPSDAPNRNVIFSSSNADVASVDENGVVTGLKGGQTVIVAKTEERGLTASCLVTVQEFVTSVKMSGGTEYVNRWDTITFSAEVLPESATNRKIRWKSNKPDVIKINSKGVARAKGYGKATIYAYASDGSGMYDKYTMVVEKPLRTIYFSPATINLVKGENRKLKPVLKPVDATFKDVEWSSSDSSVAKVDENGTVTAVASGNAVISCKSSRYGIVGNCTIKVKEYVESVKIKGQGSRGEISYGYTKNLKASVSPSTATDKRVTWNSSDWSVLSVNQSGSVTAVGYGSATITATAADGGGASASVSFNVIKPVAAISVNPSSLTLIEGRTASINTTVSPADATYTGLQWNSTDTSVATVDTNGTVTAVSAGSCQVYAESTDGNSVRGVTSVSVRPAVNVTSLAINATDITMLPGQTRKLSVRVKPSGTTEGITWYSSDVSVATVDSSGTVTSKGQGKATIYVVSSDTGIESTCDVIVLALNATYITLEQYDSFDLDVFGATETIKWYSNNKRVATVSDNGTVVGRMAGKTTIAAKVNGKVLYCTVVVKTMSK